MSECEVERRKDTEVTFESVKAKGKGFVSELQRVKWWGMEGNEEKEKKGSEKRRGGGEG